MKPNEYSPIGLFAYTLITDQLFNLEFQFKSVFNLEFQPKFDTQLGIPIPMGINLGECRNRTVQDHTGPNCYISFLLDLVRGNDTGAKVPLFMHGWRQVVMFQEQK